MVVAVRLLDLARCELIGGRVPWRTSVMALLGLLFLAASQRNEDEWKRIARLLTKHNCYKLCPEFSHISVQLL
jgi:hypothetical protein